MIEFRLLISFGIPLAIVSLELTLPFVSSAPVLHPRRSTPPSQQQRQVNTGPWPWLHRRNETEETKESFTSYMKNFGHLRRKWNSTGNDIEFKAAVSSLQRIAGLKATGVIDNATRAILRRPRCGLPDAPTTPGRKKRFTLTGGKWNKNFLNYRFQSFTGKLKPTVLLSTFDEAFKMWSQVTPLIFKQTYTTSLADIEILFASYDHKDGFPFDGPGNTLSHTFSPTDSRIHIDDDEAWTSGSGQGIDLRQVARHEIGHALGLGHSIVPEAIMNPYYPGFAPEYRLTDDDIKAIQYLYGANPNYVPPNNPTSSSPSTTATTTVRTSTTATTTEKLSSIIISSTSRSSSSSTSASSTTASSTAPSSQSPNQAAAATPRQENKLTPVSVFLRMTPPRTTTERLRKSK